jgi:hypothetical protein
MDQDICDNLLLLGSDYRWNKSLNYVASREPNPSASYDV